MRKIVILWALLALFFAGCSQAPAAVDEPPVAEKPAVETPVPDPLPEPAFAETTVGGVTLRLPRDWVCEAESDGQERFSFGPDGDGGRVALEHYAGGFAVCGTGLETRELALESGKTATVGYYDGSEVWSFVNFGNGWAAHNLGAQDWDVAPLELLAAVTFEEEAQ